MPTADPTYPLYPIANILSSALLLLVLATSFARQSWNLGVTFLCFWLFWENLTSAISSIIWSDNYDIKLYVYCDIVSRLQLIAGAVKPMCTLIIVRRLYLISSLRSVELPSSREKRNNMIIEWTLGLIIPLVVAGPLYYVVQACRFEVLEGFGCTNGYDATILGVLLIQCWPVVPPLISLIVYYPKVLWVFYRQRRDTNRFLDSNGSISRTNYFRILTLASVDLLFTFPSGIANLVISIIGEDGYYEGHIPFYSGWNTLHRIQATIQYSYAQLKSSTGSVLPQSYLSHWTSPILAFIIFGLFGLTAEARATYWRAICCVGKQFGWKPALHKAAERPALGTMEFGARPQEISLDAEMGSRPSFVNFEPAAANHPVDAEDSEKSEHAHEAVAESNSFGSVLNTEHRAGMATAVVLPDKDNVV